MTRRGFFASIAAAAIAGVAVPRERELVTITDCYPVGGIPRALLPEYMYYQGGSILRIWPDPPPFVFLQLHPAAYQLAFGTPFNPERP